MPCQYCFSIDNAIKRGKVDSVGDDAGHSCARQEKYEGSQNSCDGGVHDKKSELYQMGSVMGDCYVQEA